MCEKIKGIDNNIPSEQRKAKFTELKNGYKLATRFIEALVSIVNSGINQKLERTAIKFNIKNIPNTNNIFSVNFIVKIEASFLLLVFL